MRSPDQWKEDARRLRRDQTDTERKLWERLRARRLEGVKFRRQYPIGAYVADFCSLEQRLLVEVDGGQHADQERYDEERTRWLTAQGFRVIRFWNSDVLNNIEGVIEVVLSHLSDPLPAALSTKQTRVASQASKAVRLPRPSGMRRRPLPT